MAKKAAKKAEKKTSFGTRFVCTLLVFAIIAGATLGGMQLWAPDKYKPSTWISGSNGPDEKDTDNTVSVVEGGLVLPEVTEGNGVSLLSEVLPAAYYDAYGISTTVESAYTLTAKVDPEYANATVLWSYGYENASSEWAKNNPVEECIGLTAVSGESSVVVEGIKPFAEKIIICAAVKEQPELSASLTCNYSQKVESVSLSFGDVVCNLGDGTAETPVCVEIGQDPTGVVPGGMPKLEVKLSDVYTIAEEYTVNYELSGQYKILRESSAFRDLFLMFGTLGEVDGSTGGTYVPSPDADFVQTELLNYKLESLYFGFQWFSENLGFRAAGSQPLGATWWNADIFGENTNYTGYRDVNNFIDCYDKIQAGGTISDGYFTTEYSGLKMFDLTLTLSGKYFTAKQVTTFVMDGYTNTTPVRDIGIVDENGNPIGGIIF